MYIDWLRVRETHIKEACHKYDTGEELPHKPAQNTFLLFDGKRYPAKFIWGLAYKIATGHRLDPNTDYSGGADTVKFFKKLGFKTEYKGKIIRGDITHILKTIEYYLQEIRICYLRWVTNKNFRPPKRIIADLGANGDYEVIASPNGNAFTLSPCGWGCAYVGNGQGCVKIPGRYYPNDEKLKERTDTAKEILSSSVIVLKNRLLELISNGEFKEVWTVLQDYYWIKLGIHEFVYDVSFCYSMDGNSVRDILINSLREGEDLKYNWKKKGIKKESLERFVKYSLLWNRYACCAFDCGPIALSKGDFVHFSVIAKLRSQNKTPGEEISIKMRRKWAKKIIRQYYDLLLCYDESPLGGNEDYRDWVKARPEIIEKLNKVESRLRRRKTI